MTEQVKINCCEISIFSQDLLSVLFLVAPTTKGTVQERFR
jgi:hypothetical protein